MCVCEPVSAHLSTSVFNYLNSDFTPSLLMNIRVQISIKSYFINKSHGRITTSSCPPGCLYVCAAQSPISQSKIKDMIFSGHKSIIWIIIKNIKINTSGWQLITIIVQLIHLNIKSFPCGVNKVNSLLLILDYHWYSLSLLQYYWSKTNKISSFQFSASGPPQN